MYVANVLADAARRLGYKVRRSSGGPLSLSAYVYADDLKLRVANHPVGRKERERHQVWMDVHIGDPRPGAISAEDALCRLKRSR